MKRLWMLGRLVILAAAASSCGTNSADVRKYVRHSAHRSVALFPVDYGGAQKNAAPMADAFLERKLRKDGFDLADRKKTLTVYSSSALKKGAFNAVHDAAELAKALGAKAALVGSLDEAYDRVDRRPPLFRYDPNLHRRVLSTPPVNDRYAGMTLRLRFIDVQTEKIIWENSYTRTLHQSNLEVVGDVVTQILTDELVDAATRQQF